MYNLGRLKATNGSHRITTTGAPIAIGADVIVALADTVITTLAGTNLALNGASVVSYSNVTLKKGEQIFGNFTSITLTSGEVLAYNVA